MAKQKFSDSEVRTLNIHNMEVRILVSKGRDGKWHTDRLIPNGEEEEKTTSVPLTRGSSSHEEACNEAVKTLDKMGL